MSTTHAASQNIGEKVVVLVRPENIEVYDQQPTQNPANIFEGEVDTITFHGAITRLGINSGGKMITADVTMTGRQAFSHQQHVWLSFGSDYCQVMREAISCTMYSINEHLVVVDKDNRLEPWTSYDRVIWLAMNFIKNCPVDEKVDLPWYLLYSCFWTDPLRPTIWPDNPAGKFAWAVTTLLKYYPYSGDASHIEIVRTMLDRLIEYRVPSHLDWGNAPYASAHPGTGVYFGARADGEYATESDKVAQVGCAFIDFYKMTGDEKYLRAGKDCGQVLISHLRPGDASHSPLPFRVDVKTGEVIEEYTADMIQVVRLFDELIKLGSSELQIRPRSGV